MARFSGLPHENTQYGKSPTCSCFPPFAFSEFALLNQAAYPERVRQLVIAFAFSEFALLNQGRQLLL